MANEVGFLRKNKEHFDRLVENLKSDRHNVRRNMTVTYAFCTLMYALSFLVFFISNSFGDVFSGDDIKDKNNYEDESPFYDTCRLHQGIFYMDLFYGCTGQIFAAIFVFYYRKEKLQDDFGICNEFKSVFYLSACCILAYIVVLSVPEERVWVQHFDPHMIVIFGMIGSFLIMTLVPALRTFETFRGFWSGRGDGEVLSSEDVANQNLKVILNSNYYPVFVEHLKTEFSVENILFWKVSGVLVEC